MRRIDRNKKMLLLGGAFLLVLLALLVVPHLAGAQTGNIITNIGVGVITAFFRVAAYIFNLIFGLLFSLVSWLVEVAMNMNDKILDSSNAVVNIGWGIARDVANLGFVLIMIIVAVATIIRYEKYSVSSSKILPILIGAAILVNFSLTIAGVFISFSNTVSATFSSRLGSGNFQDAVAGAFNPQRLLLKDTDNPPPPDPASQGSALGDFSAAVLLSIAGLVFQIVFLAIATLSMAALALMLLYRYIALSLALVLAPLAWLFWAFPDLKHWFGEWWKFFLKWTFFLPAVTFFLYLAVEAGLRLGKTQMLLSGGPFSTSGLSTIMIQGAQMVVLAGLLLGGLITAQHMGIKGADGAMNLAKKGKDAALGATGRFAKTRATNVGRRVLASGVNEKGETRLERFGARFGKVPVLGAVATGISGMSSRAKAAANKDLEEKQKKIESRTGDDAVGILNRQVTGGVMMSDTDLAAWGIKAAKEGKWNDITSESTRDRIINAVKRTNSKDKILGYTPHLADRFKVNTDNLPEEEFRSRAIQEAMAKYVGDASKLDAKILKEVARYLRPNQVNQVGGLGTDVQRDAVKESLEDRIGGANLNTIRTMRNNLDQQLKLIEDARAAGRQADVTRFQQTRDAMKTQLNRFVDDMTQTDKEAKRALDVLDSMAKNISWQDEFTREQRTIPTT